MNDPLPVPLPDQAEVRAAKDSLARSAKAAAAAATELQQLALIDDVAFEPEVVLPAEEIAKRYTGTNGKNITERRLQVVKMLALQIPVVNICDILRMNHRTVAAIAAQEGQKIAVFSNEHAEVLARSAMADFALADAKREEAGPKDLAIIGGIKMTHAANLKLVGAGGGADAAAIEVKEEDPDVIAMRKFLENRPAESALPKLMQCGRTGTK